MRNKTTTQVKAPGKNRLPKNYAKIKTLPKRGPKTQAARDWRAYEAAQRRRWDVQVWISPEMLTSAGWLSAERTGERGRPLLYNDAGIVACLQIGALFRLPLRGAEHFTRCLLRFAGAEGVATPDHVTLHRARRRVNVELVRPGVAPPETIILDGTGLRAFGDGEWHRHKWGSPGSPANMDDSGNDAADEAGWVRLTVAVDYDTGQVVAFTLQPPSGDGTGELSQVPALLGQLPVSSKASIAEVLGDGLYDAEPA